jgi:hypothetical protein
MSTNNRIGRNPFDKKLSKALHEASPDLVLKTSDKKVEEQIIGELIDLPEENWQPLTMVPAQFFKQVISRWI